MTALIIIGFILLAFLVLFFLPTRICVKLRVRSGFATLQITLRLLFGILPIKLRFIAVYRRGEGLYAAKVTGKGKEKRLYTPGQRKKRKKKKGESVLSSVFMPVERWLKIHELNVFCKIGAKDPFRSVMLCGILNAVLDSALKVMVSPQKQKPRTTINFIPDFDKREFILNLEGIFYVVTTEIIVVILKEKIKNGR